MATVVLRCVMIRMEFIYISMAMPLNIYCIFSLIIHVRIKKHARIHTNLSPFSKDVISQLRPSVQYKLSDVRQRVMRICLHTRPITYIYRFKQSWEHILSPIQYVSFKQFQMVHVMQAYVSYIRPLLTVVSLREQSLFSR